MNPYLPGYYIGPPMYYFNPYELNDSNEFWQNPAGFNYPANGIVDRGKEPFVVNIAEATRRNHTFRTAIWTGDYFQVTLMSIGVRDDVGLEVHSDHDQLLRIEEGRGFVQMGNKKENLTFTQYVGKGDAVIVPAGTWHNLMNVGNTPLKLYSIYAPAEHPFGTIHETKADDTHD